MEFKEKLTPYKSVMNEMATMGRPRHLIITINSNDHKPPHFHLTNTQDKRENRFLIPQTPPSSKDSIILFSKEKLEYSSKEMNILYEWLLDRDIVAGQELAQNWVEMIIEWNRLHDDIPVTMIGDDP